MTAVMDEPFHMNIHNDANRCERMLRSKKDLKVKLLIKKWKKPNKTLRSIKNRK